MRTRTLLILAISCGLAILIAGSVLLLRLSNEEDPVPALEVGESAQLGDAVVSVDSFQVTDDAIVVTVTLSGVDDPDGEFGFTLIAPGKAVSADPEMGTTDSVDLPPCSGFTVEPVTCRLWFTTDGLQGSDRQLLFQRATEQVRWRLA